MIARVVIDYEGPTPDPEWAAALARLAPRNEHTLWWHLAWVAGDVFDSAVRETENPLRPKGAIERWVIYKMYPRDLIPLADIIVPDLLGPNPRNRGRYDWQQKRYHPDPRCNIDMLQWRIFRETGHFGRPYFVLQGAGGGHKRKWSRVESIMAGMKGLPGSPPEIGSLPYAEPDRRTWDALADIPRQAELEDRLLEMLKEPEMMTDEEREEKPKLERAIASWMEQQVDEATGWAGGESSGNFYQLRGAATALSGAGGSWMPSEI